MTWNWQHQQWPAFLYNVEVMHSLEKKPHARLLAKRVARRCNAGWRAPRKADDPAKADRYRKALNELRATQGLNVVETGESIRIVSDSSLKPGGKPGMVFSLTHENEPPQPQGFQPDAIAGHLRRLRDAEPESVGLASEIRTRRETQSLVAWADERGVLTHRDIPQKTDDLTGGEHLVEFDEDSGLVFKATHAGRFGFAADREMIRPKNRREKPRITVGLSNATPLEYLERLNWQNELFGDSNRVMGVAKYPQGVSVLTSQPFYKGDRTPQSSIDAWFAARGWKPVKNKEGAFYDEQRGILVMDALPRNVLTLDSGEIMPFDVVVIKPSDDVLQSLKL